jgi:hypothetical protein
MKSLTRSRAATLSALSLVLSVGMAAGCGGDDSSGGPEDAFVGYWFGETTTTGFTMTCTDPNFTPLFPAGNNQFPIFGTLKFEHGELTDLAETSGSCNLLNYDIKGDTATIASPDPYLTGTDTAASCIYRFTVADNAGYPLSAAVLLTPNVTWAAKRLSDKTANGADRLQLAGTATAKIAVDDGTGNAIVSTPDCTYGGMDTFFRLTRP